ncbi:MAG TPA: type 4 pilus major pilin [Rhodanobacteraceae bacterium]|nr:type 4 pilus major pilin [Rhodanobacteraceae bacterium]
MFPSNPTGRGIRQRGFSLLELLISIAVAAVIIGIALVYFEQVRAAQRDRDAVSGLHSLVAVIHQVYRTPNYGTLSGPVLAKASSFARSLADSSGNLMAPWGTPIQVGPAIYAGIAGATFQMLYTRVPTEHCTTLLKDSYGAFLKVQVGGVVLKDMSSTPVVETTDLNSILAACSSAPDPDVTLISS